MQTPPDKNRQRPVRIRRRDRHGRGLRGVLIPPGVPLYRTRAEHFDDLVLQAVARLEPQWEAHLSAVEFAVEEIPPPDGPAGSGRGPVPLSRLDPGAPAEPDPGTEGGGIRRDVVVRPDQPGTAAGQPRAEELQAGDLGTGDLSTGGLSTGGLGSADPGSADLGSADLGGGGRAAGGPGGADGASAGPGAAGPPGPDAGQPGPPRIVVYRRPLMARADSDDDLAELVFDVLVEEFARLLGIDPRDVDSGYSGGE